MEGKKIFGNQSPYPLPSATALVHDSMNPLYRIIGGRINRTIEESHELHGMVNERMEKVK